MGIDESNAFQQLLEQDEKIAAQVLLDMVKGQRETYKHLASVFSATVIALTCIIIAMIIGFFVWDSQFVYTVESGSGETITQTVDGENSSINNVEGDQYNDNATHNE